MNFWRRPALFLPRAVRSQQRTANEVSCKKTDDGGKKGKISMYCRVLKVSRQGFYQYQGLAEAMWKIHNEDVCNDTYGRRRMYQALLLKQSEGITIPSESTIYRVMKKIGMGHHPKRRPNGITKANREARKSDDLLKRDFAAEKSLEKCVTNITELKAKDGKLYVSTIFRLLRFHCPGPGHG